MVNEDIKEEVNELAVRINNRSRNLTARQISEATGINLWWLNKFLTYQLKDPPVSKFVALKRFAEQNKL